MTGLSVPQWWRSVVDRDPDLPVCRGDQGVISAREMDRQSAQLALGLLANGAQKGSRIGILLPNSPDWIVCWLAVQRIGGIAVLLSTFSSSRELQYTLRHADVYILLSADVYLNNHYIRRIEAAFPAIRHRQGTNRLYLDDCPYLRGVWVNADKASEIAPWCQGSFADLAASADTTKALSDKFLQRVEENVCPSDLGVLLYTSGSTSAPKAVLHSQFTLIDMPTYLTEVQSIIPFEQDAGDRTLITNPYFWVGGLITLVASIQNGATVVCQEDLSAAACLGTIQRGEVDSVSGNMSLVKAIINCPEYRAGDLDVLKPQNALQLAFFDPEYAHIKSAGLAMTETFGPHTGTTTREGYVGYAQNCMGKVLPGMETKIVDKETGNSSDTGVPGELCVRGKWLMEGFYKRLRQEVFDEDGFYHTGDECALDDQGFLFFHSRIGAMIKTRGANVSPLEVESVLLDIDGVLEAAVFGLPDADIGEKVIAVVAPAESAVLSEQGLRSALRAALSAYKTPREFYAVDRMDMPRTPSQKIKKPELAEMIRRGELPAL